MMQLIRSINRLSELTVTGSGRVRMMCASMGSAWRRKDLAESDMWNTECGIVLRYFV